MTKTKKIVLVIFIIIAQLGLMYALLVTLVVEFTGENRFYWEGVFECMSTKYDNRIAILFQKDVSKEKIYAFFKENNLKVLVDPDEVVGMPYTVRIGAGPEGSYGVELPPLMTFQDFLAIILKDHPFVRYITHIRIKGGPQ